jgi:hypothetical protein
MSKQLDMNKVAQLVADSAATLKKVASERDAYKEKAAGFQKQNTELLHRMEAEKVAAEMHSKGIRTEVPFDTLAEHLEKEAAAGRLETVKQALEMTGPDMMKEAFVSEGEGSAGEDASEFVRFITGSVG